MDISHHLIVFTLFAILFAELISVRPGMDAGAVARVARIDAWYGALAGLIVVVGFVRAIFAAKGWYFYSHNLFFWAKIGTFAAIGVLSIVPTLAFIRWRRTSASPEDQAVANVRRYLWMEMVLFALLPAFAVAMARGYGELTSS